MDITLSSPLVSTEWLNANLENPSLRIFDCTGITSERGNIGKQTHYDLHHIPGAAYLDMANPKGIMTNPQGPFPFCWPNQDQFETAMATLGVANNTPVILYSAANPKVKGSGIAWVTRAWWLMRHYGVECAILDGGWQKWQREERTVSTEENRYPSTAFTATPASEYGVANKEDVLAAISDPETLLIDSLSPQSYRGEIDSNYGVFGRRKGHITSAVNVHFQNMINPDTGCFRSAEDILEMVSPLELHRYRKLIAYCGGGLGATVNSVALKLAGIHNVAIYDGSLMEWANHADLPMTDYSAG